MLGTEDRAETGAGVGRQAVGDVHEPVIDRCRVADDGDAQAIERGRGQQPLGAELNAHARLFHAWGLRPGGSNPRYPSAVGGIPVRAS